MIEITQNTIDKVNTLLSGIPQGAEKAFSNAINRTLTTARSEAYKGVTKEYAITRKIINEYTKDTIKKASNSDVCGVLTFSGKQIPLYKYSGVKPKTPGKGKVFAGQKTPKAIEDAFYINVTANKAGIFVREGKSRTPISQLMGSSMRSMVSNAVVMDNIYEKAQETLDKRIDHEIERILAGYGG